MNGYSRTADYTRKTQELAQQRQALTEEQRVQREQYERVLPSYMVAMEQEYAQIQATDLTKLAKEDPYEFTQVLARKAAIEQQYNEAQNVLNQFQQQKAAEQTEYLQGQLQKGFEVLKQAIPDYGPAVQKELGAFALSIGYSQEEINSIYDPRAVIVLYNGMQYAKMSKQTQVAAKKVEKVPPKLVNSGNGNSQVNDDVSRLKAKALKTQNDQDLAAAIAAML